MIIAVTADTGDRGIRLGLFWFGLVCWTLGFLLHWFRVSLWILDLALIPLAGLLYVGGFVAVAIGLLKPGGGTRCAAVLCALAFAMVLVNPGYRVAPKTWFLVHRPLFEIARTVDPGGEYYGNPLPFPLRFLSANGNVARVAAGERPYSGGDIRFFPQWIGIPDDAGGYLYSPDGRSPAGADLFGKLCDEPVDLGDGWWMCQL